MYVKSGCVPFGQRNLHFKTYVYSKDNVICNDHFREDDFESSLRARLMPGTKTRRRLKLWSASQSSGIVLDTCMCYSVVLV